MELKIRNICKKINSFAKLTFKKKILLIIIYLLTGVIRSIIIIFPFRFIASKIGKEMEESPGSINPQKQMKARAIGALINIGSKYTPWKSECLVQALTAQLILKLFRIPNTLYFGITKEENRLSAHAWIRSGRIILTGRTGIEKFKVVNKYSNNYN